MLLKQPIFSHQRRQIKRHNQKCKMSPISYVPEKCMSHRTPSLSIPVTGELNLFPLSVLRPVYALSTSRSLQNTSQSWRAQSVANVISYLLSNLLFGNTCLFAFLLCCFLVLPFTITLLLINSYYYPILFLLFPILPLSNISSAYHVIFRLCCFLLFPIIALLLYYWAVSLCAKKTHVI